MQDDESEFTWKSLQNQKSISQKSIIAYIRCCNTYLANIENFNSNIVSNIVYNIVAVTIPHSHIQMPTEVTVQVTIGSPLHLRYTATKLQNTTQIFHDLAHS